MTFGLLKNLKTLWGVGVYLLAMVLLIEAITIHLQPWIGVPFPLTRNMQIGLTMGLGAAFVAGMIWFNTSLNLISVNLLGGERKLVTHGPFAYVRHPLYAIVLLTALPLTIVWWRDGLFVASWIVIIAVSHLMVRIEEHGLRREFGETYEVYCRYVPALLPFKGNAGKRIRNIAGKDETKNAAG